MQSNFLGEVVSMDFESPCGLQLQAARLKELTFGIPVLLGIFMHLQELHRWRTQQRNHLGEVEFVVQSVGAHSAEQATTFEEIPDLRYISHLSCDGQ